MMNPNDSTFYDSNYFYFEKSLSPTNVVSKKARAIFSFAKPIDINGERYEDSDDRSSEQEDHFMDFANKAKEIVNKAASSQNGTNSEPLKIQFFNQQWMTDYVNTKMMEDFKFFYLSLALLFLYMTFHLGSFFLAFLGVSGIAMTFPITIFINKFIFQIHYFGQFNLVAIFVVLGIAVDDIFVFTDMWKHSATIAQLNRGDLNERLVRRISYTWRKTSKAIFITSITDCISFLATGFSEIVPVASFGFFASTAVMVAYFLTISVYPGCIIIHKKYIVKYIVWNPFYKKLS